MKTFCSTSARRAFLKAGGRVAIRYSQLLPRRRSGIFFVRDWPRYSIYGRPRRLSAAQIARVLRWHDTRLTLKALAAELGVSTTTLTTVLRTRGSHYKQAAPEERMASLQAHRARRARLRATNLL